jgi:sarcosine oxidase
LRTESFTRRGLQARFPQFDADLGRLDVEAGVLYLPVITQTLLSALHRRGVTLEERTIVEAITPHGREVRIQTSLGERRARSLVVAAGIGTNALLDRIDGCALQFPILQDRPSQTKYFVPANDQRDLFVAGTLPVFAYLDVGVYGHPILEGRTPGVKIGYYNPPDVQRIETRIRSVETFVEECMPALRGARSVDVREVDQCSYDLTADDNFILGLLPGFQNIAVGVGWRGTGYKFAPLIGRTLAELAQKGRSEHAINRFSPARFVSADVG